MNPLPSFPLAVQLGLGIGYLGYLLAYGGARKGHSTLDATFLSLVFGIPALVFATALPGSLLINILFGSAISLLLASIWRMGGRDLWFAAARQSDISQDDGYHTAWEGLLNRKEGLVTSQISVHTADGRVLYLNDRRNFRTAPYEGLNLGADGSILMVVQEEEMPDGTTQTRGGICDPHDGTRLTYIPADQITRVNIRF